jgi:hypothetical protein
MPYVRKVTLASILRSYKSRRSFVAKAPTLRYLFLDKNVVQTPASFLNPHLFLGLRAVSPTFTNPCATSPCFIQHEGDQTHGGQLLLAMRQETSKPSREGLDPTEVGIRLCGFNNPLSSIGSGFLLYASNLWTRKRCLPDCQDCYCS